MLSGIPTSRIRSPWSGDATKARFAETATATALPTPSCTTASNTAGSNGHQAFNEPGSSLASRTRDLDLTQNTIKDNARFFESIEHKVDHRSTTDLDQDLRQVRIHAGSLARGEDDGFHNLR
mgnify:CR=1 FL=1